MGILRFIIAAVVIVAGLLFAALVMLLGVIGYVLQRLFGKPGRRPVFQYQYSFSRGRPVASSPPRRAPDGDVIDIEATDVKTIPPKPPAHPTPELR